MAKSKYDKFRKEIIGNEISPKTIAKLMGNGCTADHVRAAKQRFLYPNQCKKSKACWRKKNPDKLRAAHKRYRNPSRTIATNSGNSYTDAEDARIILGKETVAVIAHDTGRSIDGIYRRRVRILKQMRDAGQDV